MSRRAPRGQGRGPYRGQSSLPYHPSGGGQRGASSSGDANYSRRGVGGEDNRGARGGSGRGRGGGVADIQVFQAGLDAPIPDIAVLRAENETQTSLQVGRTKATSQKQALLDSHLPVRPGYGTLGRSVVLWANYFNMMIQADLVLKRYDIEIVGQQTRRSPVGKKLKRIVQLLIDEHLVDHQSEIVTDFKSSLLCKVSLPDEVQYSLASRLLTNKDQIIQALNLVVGQHPKANERVASVGANKHFRLAASAEQFDLGVGLTALRGFFVSVRAVTARLLVNVQVKHGAFYREGPLDKLMHAFLAENGPSKAKLQSFVRRVSIDATHILKKNKAGLRIPRVKNISGFATRDDGREEPYPPIISAFGAGPKDVKFFIRDSATTPGGSAPTKGEQKGAFAHKPSGEGKYISVYDFFKQTYSIIATDPQLPVVNVGSRERPSYLPAQVCSVLPGQPSTSALSASQTQQMIRFAVRRPIQNAESIVTSGAGTLNFGVDNPLAGTFGLHVVPKLIAVPGRVLPGPEVRYHDAKIIATRYGSWNMQSVQFTTGTDLTYWTYLWISEQGSADPWSDNMALKSTLDTFTSVLRDVGVKASGCLPGMRIHVHGDNLESEIDQAFHRFNSSSKQKPPRLILVLLPSNNSAIYNRVKFACDVQEGLLNVCVVASKFAKANSQYYANVALKVNLKLGGRNQFMDGAKLGVLSEGRTMLVGIDVTHPSPGSSEHAPSVAGIVASVDKWLGQWPADLRIQTGRQEMVADLTGMLESRLRLWARKNATLPENIIVYRDGVSEGQYNLVLERELPALRQGCKQMYPATSTSKGLPHITIIIVGKRHNTRFYPSRKEDADRSSNPQNGTVVDRGVTEARSWDFFLQAHSALQGTARPAHYYIIYDEIFRASKATVPFRNAADAIQDLTHNLCYMFGRATKAVSICPPAYYADLVCERARCYLAKVFSPSASDPSGSTAIGETDAKEILIHAKVRDSMFYI